MNKKILAICCSIIFVSVIFSGCSSSLKSENAKLSNEISTANEKNVDLEKKVSDLTKESEELNTKLKALESETAAANAQMSSHKDAVYPIYTANIDSYEKEVNLWVYIPENTQLKEKLNTIASTLSKVYFSGLPIEVSSIKEIDGKKVAVVNLMESIENQKIKQPSNYKGKSWAALYFQGSTGGSITSTSLIESFLQRDYKGEWIDGVQILYNKKPCDFEHVPDLLNINYR